MLEEMKQDENNPPAALQERTYVPHAVLAFVFLLIAGLAGTEIYSISQIRSLRDSQRAYEIAARSETDQKLAARVAEVQGANSQALDNLKAELDYAAKKMGSTGSQLKRARTMLSSLQKEQQDQANELKQEISTKADAQQVGALTDDVSATKTDLSNTKKLVDDTRNDLGMARSEFGTLIARNHDDIEQLRKMGERDYFEFTLTKNKQGKVAGVGLTLTKVNLKHHRFNMNVLMDDMTVEKKDRTIDEPIFFTVAGSKKFYELVVNQVQSNQVKGYISTPKGVTQVADERSGG